MTGKNEQTDGPDSVWHSVGQHAGWGLTIAVAIGLFLWLGFEADKRLGTLPVFTILGAFVGAGAGFYSMFRRLVIHPDASGNGGVPPRDDAPGARREDR